MFAQDKTKYDGSKLQDPKNPATSCDANIGRAVHVYGPKGWKFSDLCNEEQTIDMGGRKMSSADVTNSIGGQCCSDKKSACWKPPPGAGPRAALAPSRHHRTLPSRGRRPLPSGGGGGQPVASSQAHPPHRRPHSPIAVSSARLGDVRCPCMICVACDADYSAVICKASATTPRHWCLPAANPRLSAAIHAARRCRR